MKLRLIFAAAVLALTSSLQALESPLTAAVPNLAQPAANLFTAGQPSEKAWALLPKEGITTVINLRSDAEMQGSDEAALVKAQGMNYVHIPIAGAADINVENALALQNALEQASGKVLVHCASSNRVGALLAITAGTSESLENAISYGRSAGLSSLEPQVRSVLNTK